MNIQALNLHPDFPEQVWVVVEQPAHEEYRLEYDAANDRFVRTANKALSFARGFSGAYGWIGGMGTPPGKHIDIYLITWKRTNPGDMISGYVCGIFYRRDGDHKVIALDADLIGTVERTDLACLDRATLVELRALYPQVREGEGWYGADEARAYLSRLHKGAGGMSIQENKALALHYFTNAQQNPDLCDESFAPTITWHTIQHASVTCQDATSTPAQEKEAYKWLAGVWPDSEITVDEMIAEGDRVMARWTFSGTHRGELHGLPPTGKPVSYSGINIFRTADGKIAEIWDIYDRLWLWQQLGVLPDLREAIVKHRREAGD